MNPTSPTAQAHRTAGPSELDARRRASRMAGTLRGRVLAAVAAAGDLGLTAAEALEGLNLPERRRYSVSPRFPELVHQGFVEKTDRVRDRHAVYVVTPAGAAWAESPEATTHLPCCNAHGVAMTCKRYRRTHFVEVRPCCSIDAIALRAEQEAAA